MMSLQQAQNHRKYGVPIYGASWLPAKAIINQKEDEAVVAGDESPVQSVDSTQYIVLSGGGGEGRTGIRNALLVAHFDSVANSLSEQPVRGECYVDLLIYDVHVFVCILI